jgi:hypothetical protein
MDPTRRSAVAIASGVLCLFTAMSGAAFASPAGIASPAGGVKGDPQPEIKPFKIGADAAPGSVALEPNGSLVAAYGIGGGNGRTFVCLLGRGRHSCSGKVTLNPLSGDDTFGPAEVFVPSANHVVVLQNTCCDSNVNGSTLVYSSTDGGRAFSAPVRVGNVGVGAAALVNGNIVFTAGSVDGTQVQSVPATGATGPPASIALMTASQATDVGIGSYHGGALVGYDIDGSTWRVFARYAKSGSNFNTTGSYASLGSFNNEQLIGVSGGALLTMQTKGSKDELLLRLFNGKTFGAAHVVPHTSGGGPEWFGIDQDPRGVTHVFSSSTHSARLYDLIEESTSNGVRWSSPADLGNATDSNGFAAALDSRGSGLVLGTGGDQSWGYPVLAAQGASFSLKSAAIRKGKSTTGSGKGSPAGVGRLVDLQVERSGRWFTIATTREKSGGAFSFRIKGSAAGTFDYRAVVSDLAGYLLYGYSATRSLRVTG